MAALLQQDVSPIAIKAGFARKPSSPPAIGKEEEEEDVKARCCNNVISKKEDKCEIERIKGKAAKKYHRSCTPEEPDRQFAATPIPKGILVRKAGE